MALGPPYRLAFRPTAIPPSGASARSARLRTSLGCGVVLIVAASLLPAPFPAWGQPSVQDLKAQMLFNIAKFIEWPAQPNHASSQLTFVILGEGDLAGVMVALLSTKSINGREVFVRCVRRVEDVKDGQILFIAASEQERIPQVLEAVRGHSVLTVADVPGFAAMGGMVELVQRNDKVRFEINPASAEVARLKISAKLLALAKIVAQAQ